MARSFVAASNSEMVTGSSFTAATGWTFAGWSRHVSTNVHGAILSTGKSGDTNSTAVLKRIDASTTIRVTNAVGAADILTNARAFSINSWVSSVGGEASATLRTVSSEGEAIETDTTDFTVGYGDQNKSSIGMIARSTDIWELDGHASWVAGWSVALNANEVQWLHGGAPPWKVRPNSLSVLFPLDGGDDFDLISGTGWSRNGLVNWAPSPTWQDKLDRKIPFKRAISRGGHEVIMRPVVAT